jgi:ABC-type cobalamin transport system ATPase subunit
VLASGPIEEVFTTDNLSATYGIEVEVVQIHGKPFVVTQ